MRSLHLLASPVLALTGLSSAALAQADYVFDIDAQASLFSWTGDTSVGPIIGSPSNDFVLVGDLTLQVGGSASQAIASMGFVEGDALVSPDIHGEIPNILPFLPPLAVIDITGLRLSASSASTVVAAGGGFTADVVLTVLTGTLTLTPLGSAPTVQDLAGSASDPTAISGDLTAPGSTMHLDVPVSFVFSIDDASSGISADITLDGDIVADFLCPAPTNYCTTSPNSVGPGGVIGFSGTTSLFANDFELVASSLPVGQPGVFYFGPMAANQAFGNGTRCVGGNVVRLSPTVSDAGGVAARVLDLTGLPIFSGESRFYQFWYRDPLGGGTAFNLTDGIEVFLCP